MTRQELVSNIASFIMRGEQFHYLVKDELPAPQRSGTYTQQQTYALLKAREIVETMKAPTT
tara:strand:- start:88 stop:270 length:183 start_codon:yes stop_codon:yes gene_type:complete